MCVYVHPKIYHVFRNVLEFKKTNYEQKNYVTPVFIIISASRRHMMTLSLSLDQ